MWIAYDSTHLQTPSRRRFAPLQIVAEGRDGRGDRVGLVMRTTSLADTSPEMLAIAQPNSSRKPRSSTNMTESLGVSGSSRLLSPSQTCPLSGIPHGASSSSKKLFRKTPSSRGHTHLLRRENRSEWAIVPFERSERENGARSRRTAA